MRDGKSAMLQRVYLLRTKDTTTAAIVQGAGGVEETRIAADARYALCMQGVEYRVMRLRIEVAVVMPILGKLRAGYKQLRVIVNVLLALCTGLQVTNAADLRQAGSLMPLKKHFGRIIGSPMRYDNRSSSGPLKS